MLKKKKFLKKCLERKKTVFLAYNQQSKFNFRRGNRFLKNTAYSSGLSRHEQSTVKENVSLPLNWSCWQSNKGNFIEYLFLWKFEWFINFWYNLNYGVWYSYRIRASSIVVLIYFTCQRDYCQNLGKLWALTVKIWSSCS